MPYRISRLGLVEVRSLDLDRDLDYYLNVLGLQLTAREGKTAYMKGWDERHAYSFALTESDRAGMVRMAFRTVDPEDLEAHYNLMLCYQGKGDATLAAREQALYARFKADEAAQAITGPFRLKSPVDNNERQSIHEHRQGVDR